MKAKLLLRSGNAVVVSYFDGSAREACIVSSKDIPNDARVGDVIEIPSNTIKSGTEYGVDWKVLLSQEFDVLERLQKELRRYGIWTAEDFVEDPTSVRDAVTTVVNKLHVDLQQAAMRHSTE